MHPSRYSMRWAAEWCTVWKIWYPMGNQLYNHQSKQIENNSAYFLNGSAILFVTSFQTSLATTPDIIFIFISLHFMHIFGKKNTFLYGRDNFDVSIANDFNETLTASKKNHKYRSAVSAMRCDRWPSSSNNNNKCQKLSRFLQNEIASISKSKLVTKRIATNFQCGILVHQIKHEKLIYHYHNILSIAANQRRFQRSHFLQQKSPKWLQLSTISTHYTMMICYFSFLHYTTTCLGCTSSYQNLVGLRNTWENYVRIYSAKIILYCI